MKYHKNKFWLENPLNLFSGISLIPKENMKLSQQMNSLSRLVFIIYLILFLFNFKYSLLFLLLSLLFIVIIYYIQIKNMQRENYSFCDNTKTSPLFCNDAMSLDNNVFNNPNWVSQNQKLAGPPNPKTKINPVITPPPTDLEYWKANNFITHSAINEDNQNDIYNSGYQVSTCCPQMYNYETKDFHNCSTLPYIKENYTQNDTYNYGIPRYLPYSKCSEKYPEYNKNLFTQTIQPNVYTYNPINEPINSNIGISFPQQFPDTNCHTNIDTGQVMFNDSEVIEPNNNNNIATEANVYDPRFYGYGTSYRSYIDNNTGQPRFYYDDINAVRMPNYISRNNIDNQPFAEQYGPYQEDIDNQNIRARANDAFMNSTIQHRTELQERLMRKTNAEQWQRRYAPISTGGQRMLGSMHCM